VDLVKLIEGSLSDDLLKPEFLQQERHSKYFGHCYVASEAYYHLRGGKKKGLTPKRMRHAGVMHWWVEDNGKIVDITAAQFVPLDFPPIDYARGISCGFLTKKPSRRAQEVIRRTGRLRTMLRRFKRAGFPEPHAALYARVVGDSYSRGVWHLPLGVMLWVVPPYRTKGGHGELQVSHQVMDRTYWFRHEISIIEARELIEQL